MPHDHHDFTSKNSSDRERKIASIVSLLIGVILLSLKFYAYHITNSKSILSDALESIVNVVAGLITMIVLFIAAMPADEDHPYGHGKVESMAATFEGGAILFAGVLIVIEAFQIFFHGAMIKEINTGLIIIIIAGLANGLLGLGLLSIGKKNHSEALRSSGAHLLTDAWTSLGVIVGLFLVKFTGMNWIDPVVAAIFGFMLIYTGGKILIKSGNTLLDAHDEETISLLLKLFEKHYRPGILHIHFTRVIRSGAHHHVDCHMVVPEFWTVDMAHDFSNEFENIIMRDYPVNGELNVHLDPCRKMYCENCEITNCPIRVKPFVKRLTLEIKDVIAPTDSRGH
jgi:cation diffusion facilitator family transporter